MCANFFNFHKSVQSKQSPRGQKFSQSGHPGYDHHFWQFSPMFCQKWAIFWKTSPTYDHFSA
jgi:hypothetical protein